MTKTGAGVLTLTAASSYTGPTAINAGGITVTNGSALGFNSAVTVAAGASLNVPAQTATGLLGNYYYTPGTPNNAPFNALTTLNTYLAGLPITATALSSTSSFSSTSFDFGTNGSGFPAAIQANPNNFIAEYTGLFNAQTAGAYTFDTASDDGSMLFIDGNVVVNNNNFQGVTTVTASVNLTAGEHSIVIAYYQGGGGYGLYADVQVPGGTLQRIPDSLLSSPLSLGIGSLAGAGTVALAGNQLVLGANNSTVFTVAITGTNPLITINAGTLQLGDGVTANATVTTSQIVDNANLIFANPNPETFAGNISGTGVLIKTAPGVLKLGGVVTLSSVTVGSGAGTSATLDLNGTNLNLNNMATGGASTGNVITDSGPPATITDNTSTASTFNGTFGGAVSLTETGTGSLFVNSPSTPLTNTGTISVQGGSLFINNSAASSPVVVGNASGSGVFGAAGAVSSITTFGSLAFTINPGAAATGAGSIGILNAGSADFNGGGSLTLQFSGSLAGAPSRGPITISSTSPTLWPSEAPQP